MIFGIFLLLLCVCVSIFYSMLWRKKIILEKFLIERWKILLTLLSCTKMRLVFLLLLNSIIYSDKLIWELLLKFLSNLLKFLSNLLKFLSKVLFSYMMYMKIKCCFWHFFTFIVCVCVDFFITPLVKKISPWKKKSIRTIENFFIIKLWYFIFFNTL